MADASEVRAALTSALNGRSLPIIRQTSAQVIAQLSNPNTNVNKIADTILHDQAFTARVLKVANSAYYQRRNEKITSIAQAVMRTGYNTIRDIALAAEFAELIQKRLPNTVSLRRLLAKAFVAGHQASAVAQAAQLPEAESLFTSGLLESMGEFAMAAYLPKMFVKIDQAVQLTGLPYEEAHEQVTGMTPHEVTLMVAKAMEIPDDLLLPLPTWDTATNWNATERRQAVVHLTNAGATNLFGPESPQIVTHFETTMTRVAGAAKLPGTEIEQVLADAFAKAMEFGSHVDLDRACFALDGNTSPLSMRHSSIGMCIERAERTTGVGTGFGT
jgi:HD-like signal output (HDOD) protein